MKLKPFTTDELRQRHNERVGVAPRTATQAMAESPQPRPNNVRAILDLGTLLYFQWRGRNFGVPPLPWKDGAELLDAYLEAKSSGDVLTRETAREYYCSLHKMSKIMWKNTRTVGKLNRTLRRFGIVRNPYRKATEGELAELAVFFLGRRTITHAMRTGQPPLVRPTT